MSPGRISPAGPFSLQLAAGDDDDLIGDLQNTLLVGDDEQGALHLAPQALEHVDQIGKAPQVDAGLGLVEQGELGVAGQHRGDLNALDLPAGEGGVHLPVQVLPAAQAHPAQQLAHRAGGEGLSRGELQQLRTVKPLKRTGC